MTMLAGVAGQPVFMGPIIREESLAAMAPEIKERGLSGFGMKVGPKGVGELY